MKLSELLKGQKDMEIMQYHDAEICGIAVDSRKVNPNDVFICIQGEYYDSHIFAPDALAKGATCLVVERWLDLPCMQILVKDSRVFWAQLCESYFGHPAEKLHVIGVVGTNGKTSTSALIYSVLREAGFRTGLIGTNGVIIDEEEYPCRLTTPDPFELQGYFRRMADCGTKYVVMEISAHAIALKKTAGLRTTITVFTNFSQDHLDFFGTMEEYRNVKKSFFLSGQTGICVANGDDSLGRELIHSLTIPVVSYGIKTPCDTFAVDFKEDRRGMRFVMNLFDEVVSFRSRLNGLFNLYNILAAATTARILGIKPEVIAQGISKVNRIAGRNQMSILPNGVKTVVDFAHTPDGFQNILRYLRSVAKGNLICVFGCGGDRDASKRPVMAKIVSEFCDFAYLTNDNPRTENPEAILAQIERGMRIPYCVEPDRAKAITEAIRSAKRGDVVAILGKGHEEYQIVGACYQPFSDTKVVKRIREKMIREKLEKN
mgnify:CR=1 FL=1